MYISNVNSASVKLTSITTQQLLANEHHKIASEDLLIFYINKGTDISHDGDYNCKGRKNASALSVSYSEKIEYTY